jgi:GNAT superfamily N-acetyltransferase
MSHRSALPDARSLALRDAARMAVVLREFGENGGPAGEGFAGFDVPGSWANFAAGLGCTRPATVDDFDALETIYANQSVPAELQVVPYAHPSVTELATARGYGVVEQLTMLVQSLDNLPAVPAVPGLTVDVVQPDTIDRFVRCQMNGFHGGPGPEALRPITAKVARNPRITALVASIDGQDVFSGGLERFESSGVLIAGAVCEPWRRRGIHQAMLLHRLHLARQQGCRYALIGSTPGGPTERNALRLGFQVAWHQVSLRRSVPHG